MVGLSPGEVSEGPREVSRAVEVRSYDVDRRGSVAPRVILNWLQDLAGAHARALGASMDSLADDGLAWVLRRLRVEVLRPSFLADALELATWPTRFDRLVAHRHFAWRAPNGEALGQASSEWVMVNLATRRLARLPDRVRAITPSARVAPRFTHGTPGLAETPKAMGGEPLGSLDFVVQRAALDRVGHANNAWYIDWLLESLPEDAVGDRRLAEFELWFLREVDAGEQLRSSSFDGGKEGVFGHEVRDASICRARGRSRWVAP